MSLQGWCVCVFPPVHCGFQEWLGAVCVRAYVCVLEGETQIFWTWG